MSEGQKYDSSYMKEIVDTLVGRCLGFLADQGFVRRDQVEHNWYTRCDMDERLANSGFVAGASIDNVGRPVMAYASNLSVQAIIYAIFHESVHLAQICKQDYVPGKGVSIWKGIEKKNLPHDDPNYFSLDYQPWEHEACEWAERLQTALYKQYPEIEKPMRTGAGLKS